jgi:hypothetical protein
MIPENMTEPPRQSLVPAKLSRFVQNPENREALKRILREPAFIAAMNMLGEQSRMSGNTLQSCPDNVIARLSAYHAGVSGVYERLEALAHYTPEAADLGEWDHLQPE